MSANDLLQVLSDGLFAVIFLVATVTAVRHPRRAHVDIALFFGAFALIVAAIAVPSGRLPADVVAVAATLIMALPYLLVRLADHFTAVPPRWKTLGVLGFAVSSLGFILAAQPLVMPKTLLLVWSGVIVVYFVTYTSYGALTFVRAAGPARGVTKRRLQAVGGGSLCLGMILVVSGASVVWPTPTAVWIALEQVLLLGSGVGYFLGFAPPGWLRRAWQDPELRAFLVRTARLPSLPTAQAIVAVLEEGAAAALGAPHAAIGLWDTQAQVLRFSSSEEPAGPKISRTLLGQVFTTQRALFSATLAPPVPGERATDRARGAGALLIVPLSAGTQKLGVLCASAARPSLFVEEDLALARLLADQAAVVLEGRTLSDAVAQRTAELELIVVALEQQIAERQQAEDALQQSNAALERASQVKSEFLANMSHELRTPLNAIIGFSEVLQDETFGALNPRQQRYVGNVLESGHHLLNLVNDILDLSKVQAGRMEFHREDVNAHDLVRAAVQTLAPVAQQKQITLVAEEDDAGLIVSADPKRVTQVLYNLLSNAVKFTPAGGQVRVSCNVLPKAVAVSVTDTGIGIAPDDQERIFEEFAQVDSTVGRTQQGTGLGLALTRRLVQLGGGDLTLQSTPGQGSTFTFTMPRAPDQVAVAGVLGDVLVVEDHPATQELLRLYLNEAGYGVHFVHQWSDVVPRASALCPVAITMDLLLGDAVAWPVLHALKITAETRDIPVVIVSVLDDGQATGFALGATDYLVKPVARQDLLSALARVAGHRQPLHVLAVDDEPQALELIALALTGEPYTLLPAASGAEALALLAEHRPDVLVVDLMMAPMSGFDLISTVAESDVTGDIPIIVLTAHDLTAEDIARLNGHVAATLTKAGLQKEQLLHELQRVLRRPTRHAESV